MINIEKNNAYLVFSESNFDRGLIEKISGKGKAIYSTIHRRAFFKKHKKKSVGDFIKLFHDVDLTEIYLREPILNNSNFSLDLAGGFLINCLMLIAHLSTHDIVFTDVSGLDPLGVIAYLKFIKSLETQKIAQDKLIVVFVYPTMRTRITGINIINLEEISANKMEDTIETFEYRIQ